MPHRPLPLLPVLLAVVMATAACAETGTESGPSPAEEAATAPATAGDAADSTSPPLEPPPMADEPPPRRMPGADEMLRCDADAARGAIGQEATAEVVEQARRDAGADVVRTLKPGQVVTMEFHNSRLNLSVDADNVVVAVSCG